MINIVVYGKPRAFESHEYGFDVDKTISVDNSFPEPILKPKNYDEIVLHYFSHNGYSGVEYYNRAKGFESERDGIVFGIALKTSYDFEITQLVDNVLIRYWSDFAGVLINEEERFRYSSILDILNGTKWDNEDLSIIQHSIKKGRSCTPTKEICLLYAPDYNQIRNVESQLKEYADVYISANDAIFKESINNVVLNLAGNKIYTIKDGNIVEYRRGHTATIKVTPKKPPKWGAVRKPSEVAKDNNGLDLDNPPDDSTKNGIGSWLNRRRLIALIAILFVVFVAIFVVNAISNSKSDNETAAKGGTASGTMDNQGEVISENKTPTESVYVTFNSYDNAINDFFNVIPELHTSENSAIVSGDFEFNIDHTDIVNLEKGDAGKLKLTVIKKPEKETTVRVTAIFNGNQVVGHQDYRIAKKPQSPKKVGPLSKQLKDVNIQFSPQKRVYFKEERVIVTAKEKNVTATGGEWKFSSKDIKYDSNTNNPITIWAVKPGKYKVTYKYEGRDVATATFTVAQ